MKILLISDDPSEIARLSRDLGRMIPDGEITVVPHFGAALLHLETGSRADWIVIDPELSSTLDRGTLKIGVESLVRLSPQAEVAFLDRAQGDPSIKRAIADIAKNRADTEVIDRGNGQAIAEYLEELIKKKSGGSATVRVEQARLEGKVARLEENIIEIKHDLIEIKKILQTILSGLSEQSIKIAIATQDIVNLRREFTTLDDEVGDVSIVAKGIAEKQGAIADPKNNLWLALIGVLIPLLITIMPPIVQHYFPPRHQQQEEGKKNGDK